MEIRKKRNLTVLLPIALVLGTAGVAAVIVALLVRKRLALEPARIPVPVPIPEPVPTPVFVPAPMPEPEPIPVPVPEPDKKPLSEGQMDAAQEVAKAAGGGLLTAGLPLLANPVVLVVAAAVIVVVAVVEAFRTQLRQQKKKRKTKKIYAALAMLAVIQKRKLVNEEIPKLMQAKQKLVNTKNKMKELLASAMKELQASPR